MNKQKIKKFIVRYKYLVHILVGALGAVFIFAAAFTPNLENDHQALYDLLMGMGCSIIATVVVTIILLMLIPDDLDEDSELKEWGIINIYEERGSIKITSKRFPKNNLDFIAFGLYHFREANRSLEDVTKKVKKGLNVRILAPNPNSIFVLEQQKIENESGIKRDIIDLINWVKNINIKLSKSNGERSSGSISIKLYENIPLDFYCRVDEDIYVGPYMPDISSSKNITYQFKTGTKGGDYYKEIFEKIWSGDGKINIVNDYKEYTVMDQKEGVEAVLKYFSGLLQNKNGKAVIAVVAIFKEELRRTFFSCNKPGQEKHVCHGKMEGSVGELIKLCKDSHADKCLLFSDYTNKLAFVNEHHNRNEFIKKIANRAKKLKEDDTCAILGIPLIIKDGTKDRMIGVLTFDFAELPERYMTKIGELNIIPDGTDLSGEDYALLEEMFRIVKECEKIIVNLIGQASETEYKRLYEEEWRL